MKDIYSAGRDAREEADEVSGDGPERKGRPVVLCAEWQRRRAGKGRETHASDTGGADRHHDENGYERRVEGQEQEWTGSRFSRRTR